MRRRRLYLFIGFLASFLLMPDPARAINFCTISTVGVSFGNYNVFSAGTLAANGTVTYRCLGVGSDTIVIALNRGNAPSFQPRQMLRAGIEALTYNLYLDAGATQIWGDGTGGTQQYGPVNPQNNQDINVTIFGRIPAGQDVSIGTYSDSIVATIIF